MKVILHKLFPYAPYLNEYIGFEDEQRENETYLATVQRLRGYAEDAHKKRYPHLYEEGNEALIESFAPPYGNVINIQDEKKKIVLENIQNSQSLTQLKIYENDSMKYDLVQEYINKKQSLLK